MQLWNYKINFTGLLKILIKLHKISAKYYENNNMEIWVCNRCAYFTMHNCAYYKINFINLLKILNDHLKHRHQSAEVLLKSISVSVHTTLVNSMRFKINSIQNIHPGLIFSAVM